MKDTGTPSPTADDEKPLWRTPRIELLELLEIESAADLDVAFTTQLTSGDL